ncbi:MAG: hypothetical protein LBP92_12705 [Deltaproteobacteria bacterium]|jgi:hypothetical protein|nr:hypothetical protein [Deltaproteobacteria bacterium]
MFLKPALYGNAQTVNQLVPARLIFSQGQDSMMGYYGYDEQRWHESFMVIFWNALFSHIMPAQMILMRQKKSVFPPIKGRLKPGFSLA